jgi:hypothetical protein
VLGEETYVDLISLNYKQSGARHELGKILHKHIHEGRLETARMLALLESVVQRDGKEGESLAQLYEWYCRGYDFLRDLGLGIGLHIHVPTRYGVDDYNELSQIHKTELVNSVYPKARDLALELKNWILGGQLVLTGEKDPDFNRWYYEDHRSAADREPRIWEVVHRDEKTGQVQVMNNTLMDEKGDFRPSTIQKVSWFKRLFKR